MTPPGLNQLERMGRSAVAGLSEMGLAATLLAQSLLLLAAGRMRDQRVRFSAIVEQALEVGLRAVPIITMMSMTIGAMLAIQGIYTLRTFGAEQQVVVGVGFSVVREFGPLITGIIVAGRSGSALAARIATMKINQEIDALTVMGVDPVRFLVAPALAAMVVMVPLLTIWANITALFAAGLYTSAELGLALPAFMDRLQEFLDAGDVLHGLFKSLLFAILITLVGVINGALVTGGAEGVGRMTTRSVVHAISAIIITDMIFAFLTTRT